MVLLFIAVFFSTTLHTGCSGLCRTLTLGKSYTRACTGGSRLPLKKISRTFYSTCEAIDVSESIVITVPKVFVLHMTFNYWSYDRDVRYNIFMSQVCSGVLTSFSFCYTISPFLSALCSANAVCSANSPCSLCLQPALHSSNFSMRHSLSMPAMR